MPWNFGFPLRNFEDFRTKLQERKIKWQLGTSLSQGTLGTLTKYQLSYCSVDPYLGINGPWIMGSGAKLASIYKFFCDFVISAKYGSGH